MKTFFNLIQEVQKPGLCHRCGGCVTFCTAVNYGALELDKEGAPKYLDIEKCIECGLCYSICPEIDELEEEVKRKLAWSAPMGRVMETTVARAKDERIRTKATDGGVVTSLLVHLFDTGKIDGAIVARATGRFQRSPSLATSREEILEAAGFYFDTSQGMNQINERYLTYSSIEEFAPMMQKGLRRVALVGTPCQIQSVRRMEALEIIPSDSIKFCFGLFCSGNFIFGDIQRKQLSDKYKIDWDTVKKLNVKETFRVHGGKGEIKEVPLTDLEFMKRYACRFCMDYASEYADISFGGIGAEEGWTTVITRTPLGRAVFADARGKSIEEFPVSENAGYASQALSMTRVASNEKKQTSRKNLKTLGAKGVNVVS